MRPAFGEAEFVRLEDLSVKTRETAGFFRLEDTRFPRSCHAPDARQGFPKCPIAYPSRLERREMPVLLYGHRIKFPAARVRLLFVKKRSPRRPRYAPLGLFLAFGPFDT